MLQLLYDVILVLSIIILTGVSYEKVQDGPRRKPSEFLETRVENAQVQPEHQPDEGRDQAVMRGVLSPAGGIP